MIKVGDRVVPNGLARLANYTRRDLDGEVAELRGEGDLAEARIGDTWWGVSWLQICSSMDGDDYGR